jgi:photosystem II stability/assembly factor-like uncharacterized protein
MRSYILPFKYPFKISTTVLFIILLFSAQNIFGQSGWQSVFFNNPAKISTIVKRDSLVSYAFSYPFSYYSKYFLKTTNGGNSWETSENYSLDTSYTIWNAKFITPNIGWAVGWIYFGAGAVLKTTNGGLNWIRQNIGITLDICKGLSIVDENTIWVSAYDRLMATTNGGQNWNSYAQIVGADKINFANENTGWSVGYSGILAKTTNGGQTLVRDTSFNRYFVIDISILSSSEHLVLARPGNNSQSLLFKTSNGGNNWSLQYSNNTLYEKIQFLNSMTGYVCGYNAVLRTTNGGLSWDSSNVNSSLQINSVLPVDGSTLFAAGSKTVTDMTQKTYTHVNILKSSNSGINWSENYYNRTYNFFTVHFKNSTTGLAVADTGVIFRTTNSGNNWEKVYDGETSFWTFAFANDSVGMIVGYGGKILRTTNFGLSWNPVQYDPAFKINSILFVNEQTGFAPSISGVVLKTTDAGLNWFNNNSSIPSDYNCGGISFINENTGWILGAKQVSHIFYTEYFTRIIKTTNCGIEWFQVYDNMNSSKSYSSIKFFNDHDGLLSSGYNSFLRTGNGGLSWENEYSNPDIYFTNMQALNQNVWWAIGKKQVNGQNWATIYKTTNAGLNWGIQFSENGKAINSMFALDTNYLWFCGHPSSIYKTTNGGGIISAINPISSNIPEGFSLKQNYPNPFNPTTKINFDLKNSVFAMLRVYDIPEGK